MGSLSKSNSTSEFFSHTISICDCRMTAGRSSKPGVAGLRMTTLPTPSFLYSSWCSLGESYQKFDDPALPFRGSRHLRDGVELLPHQAGLQSCNFRHDVTIIDSDKNTNKRAQKQVYLHFTEREYTKFSEIPGRYAATNFRTAIQRIDYQITAQPEVCTPCSANPPTYPPQKIDRAMLLIQQKILTLSH